MNTATATPVDTASDPRLDRYKVQLVLIDSIKPSPENDDIYGEIEYDNAMGNLIDSIREHGLGDPLLVTQDGYILSGHRRHYALLRLGYTEVPVMAVPILREDNLEYHRHLVAYNPQRTKTVASVLKETLLRDNDGASTYAAIEERRQASMSVEVDFMQVDGDKEIKDVSDSQQEFLEAAQKVIDNLDEGGFLPASLRQIHYCLLNDPPLKQTPERSTKGSEHYRYQNDKESYDALGRLLKSARYHDHIPMDCLDDTTRPQRTFGGFDSVHQYVEQEIKCFLTGFHRNRQGGQPRHIEVFAEKNTLHTIMERACKEYYVPFTIARGFASIPVWRDIAERFALSGKERMTLIVISDYDPSGLGLADDAIKSLKLHGVPVDGHRVAVNREQIEELGLVGDYNPAKKTDKRYEAFLEKTGGDTRTWEVEALPLEYIVEQVKAAIEASMDLEIFEGVCEEERNDCDELCRIKSELAESMEI